MLNDFMKMDINKLKGAEYNSYYHVKKKLANKEHISGKHWDRARIALRRNK